MTASAAGPVGWSWFQSSPCGKLLACDGFFCVVFLLLDRKRGHADRLQPLEVRRAFGIVDVRLLDLLDEMVVVEFADRSRGS